MKYECIRPGKVWLDTNGKPIQAHGFSVFHKDGMWYLYWRHFAYSAAMNPLPESRLIWLCCSDYICSDYMSGQSAYKCLNITEISDEYKMDTP